jgi:hypothetical protein
MAYNIGINDFVAKFQGGGARPNLYMVTLNFPAGVSSSGDAIKNSYMCKAATLPQSTIGQVLVPFMGRQVKVAGDKEFPEWTVTMINDTDFSARRSFETWLNTINTHVANTGVANPSEYYADLKVEQLDRQGEVVYTYDMKACFPTEVGEVTLGYDNNDAVQEFTVTFAVNYWTSESTDGDSGGLTGLLGGIFN